MLITAGRVLIDATGECVAEGAVLIRGGTIIAAGRHTDVESQAQPGEARLSFPRSTVLPGLIDAHVHLCFDGGPDPVTMLQGRDDESLLHDMKRRAEQLLSIGVTTARDLGDRGGLALQLASAISQGSAVGPRLICAGRPLTTKGGHCWFLGGEVEGEDEIRSLIQRNIAAGAKVIKVMATGGGLTKGGPASWASQFSPEELAIVVREAHQAGLPVAAHAHGADGIAAAVAAGADTIEHCSWMTRDGFGVREDVLAQIIDKGIFVCPTTSPQWRRLPEIFGPERAEALVGMARQVAQSGARLIAGTDAGVGRAGFDGLVSSLGFYRHLGLPNSRIIEMATGEAARALGLGDVTGRIAPGYSADLLIVDGDPLADLDALRSVNTVFAAGRQYQPSRATGE
ncbi:amidohydrolase family protein [Streptomyces silvisoli]|uniref:Amidohydrolase family protein n=1 Tax=Streptomyces silvisoli TaxID=3034235 RepID=A0ABT5ZMD8_9ACTN|nr:amidohydrolase family protein [Streptomyces silvisoli]MDF3290168.1 amidohydrolase family protein [Streptomyces silvisoli]